MVPVQGDRMHRCPGPLVERAYRSDPFQLEHICQAVLGVARRHERLKRAALSIAEAAFPTGQRHVDAMITREMMRLTAPCHALAPRVARHVATYLAMHNRDRLNSYSHSDRGWMFQWLHAMPQKAFVSAANDILERAKQHAAKDYWESWHFASLYSHFHLYAYERAVLEAACDGLPQEARNDKERERIATVIALVSANESLNRGDESVAAVHFKKSVGKP